VHPRDVTADDQSDAALVVLAQRGDLAALATLFQRHRARLYAVAIGVLRDRDEAADAVQDTFITALTRISSVHDPTAIQGWLRAVMRNACRMRMRYRQPTPMEYLPDVVDPDPDPAQLLENRYVRDWIWSCLASLNAEDRLTLLLRHFSRCASYQAIATVTAVPVGTVRSRLHRAHTRLADELRTATDALHDQRRLESERRAAWHDFYQVVLDAPEPRTYQRMFNADVHVRDSGGSWTGIEDWVAEERPAIELGVRAAVVGVTAAADVTVLEIDFTNPPEAPDHCPPRSTFVHRLDRGRTTQLAINYYLRGADGT
jgi:RNA polymerase sigma-70 factor, ECF subfamily